MLHSASKATAASRLYLLYLFYILNFVFFCSLNLLSISKTYRYPTFLTLPKLGVEVNVHTIENGVYIED
jgi:hypothetical protein